MEKSSPKEALNDLYSILNIDQTLRGIDYLKTLIANIAKVLNVKYVFIGHAIEPKRTSIQTDIVWADNDYHDNFVYELSKTPCEKVIIGSRVCIHKEKVSTLFPEDELLVQMGVESYAGAPVLNQNGDLSGLFVLLDDKPIIDEHFISSIVELLAIRIDTELERCRSEDKLKNLVLEQTAELEKANKELQEANQAKDKIFSVFAHDLASPFNAILGLSHLLNNHLDHYSKEKIKEIVEEICISSENMFDLFDTLLKWTTSQMNKLNCNPKMSSLYDVVSQGISLFETSAEKKGISISSSVPEDLIAFFDVDMINSTTRNLIFNAIKFTNPGGEIKINGVTSNGYIEIFVKDSGVGISEEKIENLLRGDLMCSTKGTSGEEGTGLGIALCKEFVKKNGGTFHIKSECSKGSTFSFRLPVNESSSLLE